MSEDVGQLKRGVLGLADAFAESFALLSLALASSLATSVVAANAGAAAPWAYIVAGAGSLCLASVIIRFTRRMASAGGIYTYTARGLGAGGGFIAGWLYAPAFAVGTSFVMVISGFFLNEVLDAHAGIHLGSDGWVWCFLALLVVLTALALADIRISTRTQLVIGVASVAPILLLLVIVLAKGGDAGVTLAPFDPGRLPSSHGLFLAVVLAFTGFIGFEAAAALGEEAADPLRVIPRAILMAIAVGVVFYIFLAWVMAVGFGIDHIDQWATNPAALDTLATRYAGTWLAVLVDLGVSVGALVAALAGVNLTSRILFAMAREGGAPRAFATTNARFGTPWAAIGAVLALTLTLVVALAWIAWDDPFKLLSTDPMADAWVVSRLVAAARGAAHSGAPETAAVYLRRALQEPPPAADRPGLELELGMAEASAGLSTWPARLQAALESATDDTARVAAALVLALALGRAQRSAQAVEVLDGAAARLATSQENLATRLEAATVGVGMIDVTTAAAMSRRRDAVRRRAAADPAAPPEVLAVAAFTAVLTNEPHTSAIALATRALSAGREALADRTDRPWYTNATWFSQTTVSLVVAEDYERVGPLLDDSIARARATADSGRFAVGLAHRGWVALRCGSLLEAAADTEAALAAAELPAPTFYRVLNASILVDCLVEQGELDEAQRALAPMNEAAESGSLTAVMLRFARGRLRIAQGRTADGLQDLLAAGAVTTRSLVTCPSFLPWRSEAAMAQLALGDDEAARRLAEEELVLARAFGAPKALGVALRAAGLARGGDAGEALLREAVVTLAETPARLDRARTLAELGALLRRRNRRREARAFLREALDIAHRSGARPLTARAETELRATGARPRRVVLGGVDSLTASERRVAELAAQGMTNREIAQSLFVTARTVEGHLTNVFRKLDQDSREGIAEAMAPAATPVR